MWHTREICNMPGRVYVGPCKCFLISQFRFLIRDRNSTEGLFLKCFKSRFCWLIFLFIKKFGFTANSQIDLNFRASKPITKEEKDYKYFLPRQNLKSRPTALQANVLPAWIFMNYTYLLVLRNKYNIFNYLYGLLI